MSILFPLKKIIFFLFIHFHLPHPPPTEAAKCEHDGRLRSVLPKNDAVTGNETTIDTLSNPLSRSMMGMTDGWTIPIA